MLASEKLKPPTTSRTPSPEQWVFDVTHGEAALKTRSKQNLLAPSRE